MDDYIDALLEVSRTQREAAIRMGRSMMQRLRMSVVL